MGRKLSLTPLPRTWILDLDGVVFRHNGHLDRSRPIGREAPLPGIVELFRSVRNEDSVLVLTSRPERYRARTEAALRAAGLRHDGLLMGLPVGERILLNDRKPSGRRMAIAVNLRRDHGVADLRVLEEDGLPRLGKKSRMARPRRRPRAS